MIETDKTLSRDEVTDICITNKLFTDAFDHRFVDYVIEIDLEDYQDMKGEK
jgi:hypothetical protein